MATKAADAGADYQVQGEYIGEVTTKGHPAQHRQQVVALGNGKFDVLVYPRGLPGDGWKKEGGRLYHTGETKDGVTAIAGQSAPGGSRTGSRRSR